MELVSATICIDSSLSVDTRCDMEAEFSFYLRVKVKLA